MHAQLIVDGTTYPIHKVVYSHNHNGLSFTAEGWLGRGEAADDLSRYATTEKAAELYAFAKTGAPPAPETEGNTSDLHRLEPSEIEIALRDREAAFNDSSVPHGYRPQAPREFYGTAMLADATCRDECRRALPRMQEQRPWVGQATSAFAVIAAHYGMKLRGGRPASISDFVIDFHASNQRWWHDLVTGEKLDRNLGEMVMLVTSEIAEALEGERKDLMDDHLPHRKMVEVELADAIIRIADIVGSFGRLAANNFQQRLSYIGSNDRDVSENKGAALKRICDPLAHISETISPSRRHFVVNKLARCWHRIERYADKHDYDLWGAVFEKMEYNKHRADHKPEARLAANGKKF